MTRFLLGDLDPADRNTIEERLIADPQYFEALAALEDDLILRWHRGELSGHEQRLFALSYFTSPSRQARVADGRQLIEQAKRWEAAASDGRSVWKLPWHWRTRSWDVPRFAMAGAVGLLVVTVSLASFTVNDSRSPLQRDRAQSTGPRQVEAPPRLAVAFTLTPVGDRSTTANANLVLIPREADEVWLQFEVPDLSATDGLEGMVESLAGGIVAPNGPVRVTRGAASSQVALRVASGDLPDGDYVLRLQRAVSGGGLITLASRAFRVMHN